MPDFKTATKIQNEIVDAILDIDSTLAVEEGQPLRRIIIDPISQVLESAYQQDYRTRLLQSLIYITGEALDLFMANFGFTRKGEQRATGYVNFSRETSASMTYYIPAGTKVSTSDGVEFVTVQQGVIAVGETSTEVPIMAMEAGTSGNVAANAICMMSSAIIGIQSVTNAFATTGGEDKETDEEVKKRFRIELFRNICGSSSYYISTALGNTNISLVNVVEAYLPFSELVEFELISESPPISGAELVHDNAYNGTNTSIYVESQSRDEFYSEWELMDDGRMANNYLVPISGGDLFSSITAGNKYYWVSYEYTPMCSRGVGKVDVFVIGDDEQEVSQTFLFNDSENEYRLLKTPVKTIKSVKGIVAGESYTFVEERDYVLEQELPTSDDYPDTAKSIFSQDKIVWQTPGDSTVNPDDQTQFTVTYTYNDAIWQLQKVYQYSKPVGVDVLVHEGTKVDLNISMKVMLAGDKTASDVDSEFDAELEKWIDSLPFGAIIQFSDIEQYIRSLVYVDAVEIIQIIAVNNDTGESQTFTSDFILREHEAPVLGTLTIQQKSYTSWS